MRSVRFEHQTNELQPSGKEYSKNVLEISPLPIWTDGEQCVSKWKLSLKERLQTFILGHIWVSVLSGKTQPPILLDTRKEYLTEHDV